MIRNYLATKTLRFIVLFLFLAEICFSQNNVEIIPNEVIVQLVKGTDVHVFVNKYLQSYPSISYKNTISKNFDLYLFEYDDANSDSEALFEKIRQLPQVNIIDHNFKLKYRSTIPSDTFYDDQWDMDRIEAPEAWDITTGGLTADDVEIVIAVIEGGDIDHEDVQGNIWENKDEIPDNGEDDDDNGYIDDYYGVNVMDSTDNHIKDSHSTSVMGIMGARGNNNLGVTGVNWHTKLMIVSNNLDFDKIIESYDYVYKKRKEFNESNGTKGAFVVATNSSFGVDDAFPEDNPYFSIWCAMYDSLGSVGVLSAAATTNSNVNVNLSGDMPATCSSEYMIAVTNTDINEDLQGGYSSTYIDLSAPGKNSYTLKPNDGYGNFGGTSSATPHVTGAIGLLYSLPCSGLMKQAMSDPSGTALVVKRAILDGVDLIESLEGKAVTEGRLNLFKSLENLQSEFGTVKGNLNISKIYPNPSASGFIKVEYQTPEFQEYTINIYNSIGQLIYIETIPEFCSSKVLELPTTDWASGVYFITIGNASDITSAKFSLIWPNY